MSELLPCPFCSAEPEILSDGRRTWGLVQHNDGCLFPTYPKHEIPESDFAAWNSRADYHGYEQAAIEAWESIKAWNSRAERTCKWELEHSGTLYDKWRCSKCGYLFVEPRCDQGYTDLEPNYCPNCGRKVEA